MALPSNKNSLEINHDVASISNYRNVCVNFIHEISNDYLEWIDYYKLHPIEDAKRKTNIDNIVQKTSAWINNATHTIKSIDVIMNDGIQKMAEATAGYPFQIGVFIDNTANYTISKPGIIDIKLKSIGRDNRKTKLGFYQKNNQFRIDTTRNAFFDINSVTLDEFDFMDINLKLNALQCVPLDIISFTIIVAETDKEMETERRGVTTLIKLV